MAGRPIRRAREGRAPAPGASGSWPPFTIDNEAATTHGAHSPRRVASLAAEVGRELPRTAPWTRSEAFARARLSLAWCEAQLALVRGYVDEHGVLDDEGRPRPAAMFLDKLEARAGTLRGELALTPASMAKLLGVLAGVAAAGGDGGALDALRREGARILEARQALMAAPDPEPAA